MYIRPTKRRQSSPLRVLILTVLVLAGGYILLYRRDLIEPIQIGPTPTPTPTAGDGMDQARVLSPGPYTHLTLPAHHSV